MGATQVHASSRRSRKLLGRDVAALKKLSDNGHFRGPRMIGLELEGCGTSSSGEANLTTWKKVESMDGTTDFKFQGEVGAHNFEINFSPIALHSPNPFKELQDAQENAIAYLQKHELNPVLSGVFLPFRKEHLGEEDGGLNEDVLSKILNPGRPRYKQILDCWRKQLGYSHLHKFEGHSEIVMHTFLIEVLMTSQHIHISVDPEQIADALNIASMISAACQAPFVSSPRFLGKLGTWQDYRYQIWRQCFPGRTGMGPGWCSSLNDYFKKIQAYDVWLDNDDTSDPFELIRNGQIPTLHHIPIFQGCLWWDTRPKFFKDAITIEERTMGSASPFDNTTKAVLWTGLMRYFIERGPEAWKTFGNFTICEENAKEVSHYGLNAQVKWFNKRVSVRDLILDELIPRVKEGHADIALKSLEDYFENLIRLCKSGKTQAEWIRSKSTDLSDQGLDDREVDLEITKEMQKQIFVPVADRS